MQATAVFVFLHWTTVWTESVYMQYRSEISLLLLLLLPVHTNGRCSFCRFRSAEYLRHGENEYTEIRRREEISDLFATINSFPGLSDLVGNLSEVDNHLSKSLGRKNLDEKQFENGYLPSHAPCVLRSRAGES